MPYITVSASGEELDRRELTDAPIVIGRAPECQVSVHDILLSRRHCRIEADAAARGAGGKPRENGRPRDASKRPPSPRPRMSDVSPDETQGGSGLNDFSPSSSGPVARTAANRLWELEEGGEARSSFSQDI